MIIVKQDNIEVLRFEPIELRRVYDLPKFCALDNNKIKYSESSIVVRVQGLHGGQTEVYIDSLQAMMGRSSGMCVSEKDGFSINVRIGDIQLIKKVAWMLYPEIKVVNRFLSDDVLASSSVPALRSDESDSE